MSAPRWPAHPAADLFPEPTPDEYRALLEDIRANGVATPVVICDGQLLDGRTRLRACEELGIECPYREWSGPSPVAYAVSLNLKRRHLTTGQKAAIAVDMLPLMEVESRQKMAIARREQWEIVKYHTRHGEAEEGSTDPVLPMSRRSTTAASKVVGVGRESVEKLKQIQTSSPDLFAQVRSGKLTVTKAAAAVRQAKHRAEREAAIEAAATTPSGERRQVELGTWWRLRYRRVLTPKRQTFISIGFDDLDKAGLAIMRIPATGARRAA